MKKILLLWLLISFWSVDARATEIADTVTSSGECRLSLRSSLVGASSAVIINAAVTEVLKNNIKEHRPDGSDSHSFPSRHASYAFAFGSVAAHELCFYSPLWVSASHTLANAVAMQRVYASRHYPGDVLAGAALGLASAELGYCLSKWIFPSDRCRADFGPVEESRALTTSTVALVTFCDHSRGVAVGSGIESAAAFIFPLSDSWSVGSSLRLRSHPVYLDGAYVGGLNGAAVSADGYFYRTFGRWQGEAAMSLGLVYNFDCPAKSSARWSPVFDLSAGIFRGVARHLSIGPRVGVDITKRPSALCALTVSIVAKAEF